MHSNIEVAVIELPEYCKRITRLFKGVFFKKKRIYWWHHRGNKIRKHEGFRGFQEFVNNDSTIRKLERFWENLDTCISWCGWNLIDYHLKQKYFWVK